MLSQTPSFALTLEDRFALRQRLVAMKDEIDQQLKDENEAIKLDMLRLGVDEYPVGDEKFVLSVRNGRASLDKGELVALGVSTDTIARATKHGDPYTQLDVRKV